MKIRFNNSCLALLITGIFFNSLANCQTVGLVVGSASGVPGASVTVGITLAGGMHPAGLQWTVSYPVSAISNLTVTTGSSAINAGKSVYCSGGSGSNTCLLIGLNATGMADGLVAVMSFQTAINSTATLVPIQISGMVAASPSADSIPTAGTGGTLTLLSSTPRLSSLSCLPSTLLPLGASQCTVSLMAVTSTPVTVSLASGNTYVAVPATVQISTGQSAAQFAATAGPITTSQTTVLTASLSGMTQNFTLYLSAMSNSLTGSFAQIVSEGGWATRQVLVNTGETVAQAHLKFFDDSGMPLTLPIANISNGNAVVTSSLDQAINPNALSIVDTKGSELNSTRAGWGQLSGDASVSGFGIFSNPGAKWAAAVPIETRNASSYILAFDNTGSLATGVAVANVASQTASIQVVIRDDTGAPIGAAAINLAALGHTSFLLGQQYPETAGRRGSVEFDTPVNGQISVVGLRANGPALTTLPVLAGGGGGSIPHLTYNAGFTSTFYIVNTGSTPGLFALNFFDEGGKPLAVPLSFPQTGTLATTSVLANTLAAGALLVVDTRSNDSLSGVVGSAQLTTAGNISGFEVFRWTAFGQEASVPLETRVPNSFILVFDNTGGLTTGVALTNNSSFAADVTLSLRDVSGTVLQATTIHLASLGHTSFMLPDRYPTAAGKRGTIEFIVPPGGTIGAIGLRATADGELTTIPVLIK